MRPEEWKIGVRIISIQRTALFKSLRIATVNEYERDLLTLDLQRKPLVVTGVKRN